MSVRYFDLHTHRMTSAEDVFALVQNVHTQGIHPADIREDSVIDLQPGALAVGECGLDCMCGVAMDVQERIFRQQIALSEAHHLPLILHCVKALDDVLRLRRTLRPSEPWVFHGFRGKPQQLNSLIASGCYVSFGPKYNPESLRACPIEHLFLETDDSGCTINDVYVSVAECLRIQLSDLQHQLLLNAARLHLLPSASL